MAEIGKTIGATKTQLIIAVVLSVLSEAILAIMLLGVDLNYPQNFVDVLASTGLVSFVIGAIGWLVMIWAGYAAVKALGGGAVQGGVAGAIVSVVSGIIGLIVGLVAGTTDALLKLSLASSGAALPESFLAIALVIGFVSGIIVAAIIGFILGAIGGYLAGRK